MTARLHDHSTGSVRVLQLHLGGDRNFSYLVGDADDDQVAAIDPGFRPDELAAIAADHALRIRRALITHGHHDHTGGMARLLELTGATAHAGRADRVTGAVPLDGHERLPLGAHDVEVLATPGHSPGHLCYHYRGQLFTGDLLFCGKVGGTGPSFPGSSAAAEWDSLHRLLALDDATRVFPGHDFWGGQGTRVASSIGDERRTNPFLLCPDLAAFESLKAGWAAYKQRHGIR